MRNPIFKSGFLFTCFLLFFLACQTGQEQPAIGKALAAPPDNTYSTVKLEVSDTTSPEARKIIHSLDSFYKITTGRGFNGSVLVGYKGKILYERYFGYADRAKGIKLSPNSPSQLASTSKPFLATAILWLHQNNYLDINKPVNNYLSSFPYPDITIKMLMNHRSGLPKYLHIAERYWNHSELKSNEDLLQLFAKYKPRLSFKPGTRFQYCNSNYVILARVLEEVTAISYPQFMKEFIFKPLGMDHTFVYDPLNEKNPHPNRTVSYQRNWRPYPDMYADGIYGDKNIYSTVRDLYLWDQSFYHHTLLNPETLKLSYTGNSNEMPGTRNYGLGWRMMDYSNGYKVIYHNGWWHGNNTVFYRFVHDNFTIIVLGNRMDNSIYSHAKAIYDIVQKDSKDKQSLQWDENG